MPIKHKLFTISVLTSQGKLAKSESSRVELHRLGLKSSHGSTRESTRESTQKRTRVKGGLSRVIFQKILQVTRDSTHFENELGWITYYVL